jgi:hypothetical protein
VSTEDYWREHASDTVPVKLIDLASCVARMKQVRLHGVDNSPVVHERIFTCDLPRLEAYLPEQAAALIEDDLS